MNDCESCIHKKVCDLWHEQERQDAGCFFLDDCELFESVRYTRLRELAEADKDGRVVVLPCKVGDTVYRLQYIEQTPGRFTVGVVPIKFALIWLEEIGKTVFPTREEAEKALQEMEGKKDGNETNM